MTDGSPHALFIKPLTSLVAKNKLAMTRHPGTDTQFGVPVAGRRVDMVDAVFEEDIEHAIGFGLGGAAEGRRPKEGNRAQVSRTSKGSFGNHMALLYHACKARAAGVSHDFSCGEGYRRMAVRVKTGRQPWHGGLCQAVLIRGDFLGQEASSHARFSNTLYLAHHREHLGLVQGEGYAIGADLTVVYLAWAGLSDDAADYQRHGQDGKVSWGFQFQPTVWDHLLSAPGLYGGSWLGLSLLWCLACAVGDDGKRSRLAPTFW